MVKSGEFEVLERRQGINMRVNRKARGDCFGEVSLMYSCPRSATVAALQDAVVWVLERQLFRRAFLLHHHHILPKDTANRVLAVTAVQVQSPHAQAAWRVVRPWPRAWGCWKSTQQEYSARHVEGVSHAGHSL